MKIPEYQNIHGVNASNLWIAKARRIEKAHEDQFEKELEDSILKRKFESKEGRKKIITQDGSLDEIQLEADHLFAEYEQKVKTKVDIALDEERPKNGNRFSSWG